MGGEQQRPTGTQPIRVTLFLGGSMTALLGTPSYLTHTYPYPSYVLWCLMARGECITSRPLVATRICIYILYIYTHIWSYLIICANPVSRTIMWCSATSNSKILGSPCRGPNSWWLGDPPFLQNPSCRKATECAAVSKIAFRTTAHPTWHP